MKLVGANTGHDTRTFGKYLRRQSVGPTRPALHKGLGHPRIKAYTSHGTQASTQQALRITWNAGFHRTGLALKTVRGVHLTRRQLRVKNRVSGGLSVSIDPRLFIKFTKNKCYAAFSKQLLRGSQKSQQLIIPQPGPSCLGTHKQPRKNPPRAAPPRQISGI